MGFLKKVFKGIKKAFKKVVKTVAKVMDSKLFKVALIGAAVFTLGSALLAAPGVAAAGSAGAAASSTLPAAAGLAEAGSLAAGSASIAGGTAGGLTLMSTPGLTAATAGLEGAAAGAGLLSSAMPAASVAGAASTGAKVASAVNAASSAASRFANDSLIGKAKQIASTIGRTGARAVNFVEANPTATLIGGQVLQNAFTPSAEEEARRAEEWRRRNTYFSGVNYYGQGDANNTDPLSGLLSSRLATPYNHGG